MGYLDLFDLLLEEEVGLWECRRFRNALRLSGPPNRRPLTSSVSPTSPAWAPARSSLATLELVRQVQRWIARSAPASANYARRPGLPAGLSILFTTLEDLVRPLRAAQATGRFNRQLRASSACLCGRLGFAICPSTGPKPAWFSNSSPAATKATP